MKNFNATNNVLGAPLTTPSKQTSLPVICGGNGNVRGFFAIQATRFVGTETTFTLADGAVAIESVTLGQKSLDGSGYGVGQYMAAVYPDDEESLQPWLGYSAFVDLRSLGYSHRYVMPTQGWRTYLTRGILVTNLLVNMAADESVPAVETPPVVGNGAIRWAAAMSANSAQLECGFFDFNWVDLFQAKSDRQAIRIDIVANPAGGEFKSTIVPYPSVAPQGAVQFNTIRIIKLDDVAAGDYTFTYVVTDDQNQSTTCTLVLTVVGPTTV